MLRFLFQNKVSTLYLNFKHVDKIFLHILLQMELVTLECAVCACARAPPADFSFHPSFMSEIKGAKVDKPSYILFLCLTAYSFKHITEPAESPRQKAFSFSMEFSKKIWSEFQRLRASIPKNGELGR